MAVTGTHLDQAAGGETSPPGSVAGLSQGEAVKEVFAQAILMGTGALQVSDMVTQLLDQLHLLIKVVSFQEVTHLWVE